MIKIFTKSLTNKVMTFKVFKDFFIQAELLGYTRI